MTRTAIESFNYVRDSFDDNLVKQFNLAMPNEPIEAVPRNK